MVVPTIICVDLDKTITADPQFFRAELAGLRNHGARVFVLTGNRGAGRILTELGFVQGRDYDACAQVPLKHIARAKVAFMRTIGATHLIDNRRKNCAAARDAGFTAHHVMSPRLREG